MGGVDFLIKTKLLLLAACSLALTSLAITAVAETDNERLYGRNDDLGAINNLSR